jgi:ABC-2 type transport system ATP-binding protein
MESTAPAQPPLISARNVHVRFDKLLAVNNVSFDLRGGELLGLIGPNGAGKTTLLRSLAALQPIHFGSIRVLDEELNPTARDALNHIGFTSDTPPLYDNLTVRDYLRFIAMGYNLPRHEAEERIGFWLEKLWLSEKVSMKIKGLSRGMRQRIGIARALLSNPPVVLLDEPAAGLDPAGRVQFRQLLLNLREQSKAIIVSSHILSDLGEYCTHIGIMTAGKMMQFGTVQQVTEHANDGRCRYTLQLARPVAAIPELLGSIDGIRDAVIEDQRVVFSFSRQPDEAADLLAQLITQHRLPVASFAPNAMELEEAYLRAGISQVD